jgi:lipopolysaccharide export system protein LptA
MRGLILRIALALGVAAVIGLSILSMRVFGRYQPLAGLMGGSAGLAQIGLELQNSQAVGLIAGRPRWKIGARLITFSRDQRSVSVTGVSHGKLYDAVGHVIVALRAGGAVYQSPMPIFSAGPVGVLQVSGGIQARLLQTFGPTIMAAGLTWNPLANQVQSIGPVTAQFPARAGTAIGGARLTADSLMWSSASDQVQSPNHARVVFANGVGSADGSDVQVDLHTGNLSLRSLTGTFNLARVVQTDMASRSAHPLAALTGVALLAAPLAASAPAAHPVTYSTGAVLWLNDQHQAQMSQGVTIKQDDETLQTEAAIVNFDDQQQAENAQSRAPVHLWDTQDDLTGQNGIIDFQTHVATVSDTVVVVVKPSPGDITAPKTSLHSHFDAPATLTCQKIIYDYHRKFGTIPGSLTVHEKDRILTADSGTYDARTQIVTLIGHVHGKNGDGVVNTSKAVIGVRTGKEFLSVRTPSSGIFTPHDDGSSSDNDTNSSGPVDDEQGYDAIMNGGPTAPPPTPDTGTPASPTPTSTAPSTPTVPPQGNTATPPGEGQPAPK